MFYAPSSISIKSIVYFELPTFLLEVHGPYPITAIKYLTKKGKAIYCSLSEEEFQKFQRTFVDRDAMTLKPLAVEMFISKISV